MTRILFVLTCWIIAGCGRSPGAGATRIQQYVVVIDHTGSRRVMPAGELIDPTTGGRRAKSVLVIDRQTGFREWADAEEIGRDPPLKSRYVPVTQTQPTLTPD
jgi:hypothetical protein